MRDRNRASAAAAQRRHREGRTQMFSAIARLTGAALVCLALGVCARCSVGLAASGSARVTEYMSPEELKPGMMGRAKSVFSGTTPEEFDVEILGVIHNWRPGGDLILGRASGEKIERLGISAGMSGSPVYVGGKLVGAIAFTWTFAKEPFAGITPIREMLESGKDRAGGGRSQSSARLRAGEESAAGAVPEAPFDGGAGMKEIGTPIMVAGVHPQVLELMKEKLAGWNMVVAQSGSGSKGDRDTLVPGGSLAAQLVSGDAVVSAIGTVTDVEGTRVVGFGHGLFSAGPVEVPMSGAHIHAVLPSLANSMKLGSASGIVGTITDDGDAGVSGEIGRTPDLVPVEVRVDTGERVDTFQYQVIRHRLFTPALVAWTAASSALTAAGAVGELTVRMDLTLELDGAGVGPVRLRHTFFSVSSASPLAEFLTGLVDAVMNNEFEAARLGRVRCDLTFVRERRVARLEEAYVLTDEAKPGEDVTVAVKLRPYRGRIVTKLLSVRLPEGLTGERLELKICSAPEMEAWKQQYSSRSPSPRTLAQLVSRLERMGRGDVVECGVYVEEREAAVGGETLPSPPESMARVMTSSRRAGGASETGLALAAETSWETGYAVEGCLSTSVKLGEPGVRR